MRRTTLRVAWAVLFCLAAAPAHADQTGRATLDSVPDKPPPIPIVPRQPQPVIMGGGVCGHDIQELNGVVTVRLEDRQRAGQVIQVVVDDLSFRAAFDAAGRLTMNAPLLRRQGTVSWPGLGGQACSQDVTFQTYDATTTAAVIWSDPFDLALHVLEPDGQALARDWGQPDTGRTSGQYGQLRAFGSAEGTKILLYTLPPERNPGTGVLYFFIAFASRGNPARPPFCGQGERAAANYHFITIVRPGRRVSRNLGFNPAACGHSWQREGIGYEDWQSYQENLHRNPG